MKHDKVPEFKAIYVSKILKLSLSAIGPALLFCALAPAAEISDEDVLLHAFGDEEMISIATGKKQPVSKAPAVTTVVTADDIKAIGATDLDEILETVPGLHVARNNQFYSPIYAVRGVFSQANPQVLVLINGISITNLFAGDRNLVWGGMPVEAIQRVEIIRGPGSAVYGADAFAGVINIITKPSEDLAGTEIGGRRGSFDTWDGWLLHGGTYKGFEVAAMLEYHDTDGQRENVEADAQTLFDNIFGSNASLAPGPVNVQRENIDARLDIHRKNWRLRAGLQRRQDIGTGVGVAEALDPDGRFNSERWNVDLTYHNPLITEHWDVEAQVSYFDTSQEVDSNVLLFPRETVLPIGPDGNISPPPTGIPALFPNGFIGNPEVFERHTRFNVSAFYTGFERHLLRMGAGFNYADIWKVKESKNFGIDPSTGARIEPPGSRLVETTDTPFAFLSEGDRKNYYFFLQDSWRFANDWELTGGLRYDHFSDFGNAINPRFALVWQARQNLTSKLLYGEAFRAPSFVETRNINNPVVLGNPDLEPEKMRTVEIALDYLPIEDFRLSSNVYRYWWSDIIQFVPGPGGSTAQNTGEQTGYGLEIEADWRITSNFRLLGNYAFQISEDETSDEDAGNAPHHQVYVRADWEFLPSWYFNPQLNWIVDRDRVAGDNRPEIDDYSTVDLTLRRIGIHNHWDVAFAVRNLFDSDVREPSLAGSPAASIPNDLPQAGRSFYGEVRFRF